MSYSCSDFTDSILEALAVEIPNESNDSPSDQADIALEEIERLQRFEKETRHALAVFDDEEDYSRFVARLRVVAEVANA